MSEPTDPSMAPAKPRVPQRPTAGVKAAAVTVAAAAPAAAAPKPPQPPVSVTPPPRPGVFEDEPDDEFEDDGVSQGGNAQIEGEQDTWVRGNGQTYIPRYLGPYQDIPFLRHARGRQEHVLLYGPPGTGKTAMVDAGFFPDAATVETPDGGSRQHRGMYSIVCNVDTTEADFVGGYVQDPETGRFRWSPGPLMLALLDAVPIFVDEVLLADPRVLSSCLYPTMDGTGSLRIAANPDIPPIPVPDGFFVVGAGNPNVPGANFSPALRSRFDHHIEVSTDWALARKLRVPAWMVRVAKELDTERLEMGLTWSPQLRELLSFRNHAEQYGTSYAIANLVSKAPEGDDRDALISALKQAPESGSGTPKPLRLGGQKPGKL